MFAISFILFLLIPGPSLAVQVHGPPEGYYVHQIGHLLFISSIIFFLTFLKLDPPSPRRPWMFLKISMFLFLLWNINALIAHYFSNMLPREALDTPLDIFSHRILPPITTEKYIYFITRNDHLLCVPAMFFLVLALRAFRQTLDSEDSAEDG